MYPPFRRTTSATLAVAACAFSTARADIAWLDFQKSADSPAPLHQAVPAITGASASSGGVTFTLTSEGLDSRVRDYTDPLLKDFAMIDGRGAAITLSISGLPAGSYTVDSWHFDPSYPGAIEISYVRVGEPGGAPPTILVPHHSFAITPATYTITSDGHSSYELIFRENNADHRVRLNGLHLCAADAQPGLPGIFVDIDSTNTSALSGVPDPFFTNDATHPGFTSGPLWRRRAGFGCDAGGNREVYEKDANGGIGDATPLVTIVRGLTPGKTYGVYVAFLSVSTEQWQVKAGLSMAKLETFSPRHPVGRIIDLGLSAEIGSPKRNRNQYVGFIGNATVGPDETLRLYSDDGDSTDVNWTARSWLDGFFLGAPVSER